MLEKIVLLVMCHMIGDYVLQSDFIARTKGNNWYHLFVHCVLYIVPFYICFGLTWQLAVIFIAHIIIDPLKARYNKMNYCQEFGKLGVFAVINKYLKVKNMDGCKGCVHYDGCGYFDCYDSNLTEEENFIENCVGCCCGDGFECNRANGYGCMNWEDGSKPLLG